MQRGIWNRILRKLFVAGSPVKKRRGGSAHRPMPARRPSVRPQLEGLEDRTLLSGNTYIVDLKTDSGGPAGTSTGPFSGDLRFCINQADLNPGSTVTFSQTVFDPTTPANNVIKLSNGELPISASMTIVNPSTFGATITVSGTDGKIAPNGNRSGSRVFDIMTSGATVTISNLVIENGNANVYYTSLPGNQGGDIFNGGNLTLTNDVVKDGFSVGVVGGPPGRGGGIFNAEGQNGGPGATLTLNNTIIENNTAEGAGGIGAGGGVYNDSNATLIVANGSQLLDNTALGNNANGPGAGGGIYNRGILQLNGTASNAIVVADNVAQGGTQLFGLPGGNAYGGGVFNAGSMSLQYVTFLGNQAEGGAGGDGAASQNGGNGGNAQGGAIYNAGSSALLIPNVIFGADILGTGNQAVGGVGGKGGDGAAPGAPGGDGGNGGFARGGAVASTSGGLTFKTTSFTSSKAIGGNGGNGGNGVAGLNATATGAQGQAGGHGGNAGKGGDAFGGAVFNSGAGLDLSDTPFTGNVAVGGTGGKGGTGGNGGNGGPGSDKLPGGTGGTGGYGGSGGVGGGAQGGGFYNVNGTLTIGGGAFTGNQAIGGNGGQGNSAGDGGQGGDNGSTVQVAGLGGVGGPGGKGGDTLRVSGGAGEDQNGDATISGTFTSNVVQVGIGGNGGNGGNGGDSGNNTANPPIFALNGPYGGAGGNGGAGGSAGAALGGALAIASSNLTATGSTFTGNQVIGGAGGTGGIGGTIGSFGHPSTYNPVFYVIAFPEGKLNPAGNGGAGGVGSTVSGGAVSVTSAPTTGVDVLSRYQGLNSGQSGGFEPANPQGAAGTDSYVEVVNQAIAIYTPKSTGTSFTSDLLADFWTNQGKLPRADIFSQFSDPAVVWDDQIQRFIVVDQDVDGFYNNGFVTLNKSFLDIAVSKSNNPASLTAADWNFFQIATTESPNGINYDPQYPANIGWNHDALVVTLNMFNQSGVENHVEVNTISINDLLNDKTLIEGTNAFQFDYSGINLRPAVMHDSKAGDPVWFVQAGASTPTISVVEMTNPLSSSASFTATPLQGVAAYSQAVPLIQPDGSKLAPGISSDIEKVAEQNNLLVAAQTVSDAAGDEDSIQWYLINVSSGTPVLQQQGDVGGGTAGVYDAFPSIDINAQGDIGMTYLQTGTGTGQFPSMYVTGRAASDTSGTMRASVLVQGGLQDYNGLPPLVGPVSSINVDSDGSFWAANEYADLEPGFNWSTEIAHFSIPTSTAPTQRVSLNNSTFTNNSLTGGNGGTGGQAGLLGDDGRNHGINGRGGDGGFAQGGTVFLSANAAQGATLDKVKINSSSATAGAGGDGTNNFIGSTIVSIYWRPAVFVNGSVFGWNGFGSDGGTGGSVEGVGIAAVNYALNLSSTTLNGGSGTAGVGGNGGSATATAPRSWAGGKGGAGGSVLGGGVYFHNDLNSAIPLSLSFTNGSASNYALTAGNGGNGGNAGASTTVGKRSNVSGGVGGNGGQAQGGGLYVFAGSQSINAVTLTDLSLMGNEITAGTGGRGGAGYLANGGLGGNAQGGAVFSTSLNTTSGQSSSLSITASTLAGNSAAAGGGGDAGSATTPNGGAGGTGGNGGQANGAGMYNGQNTNLTVINSTFGGGSTNTTNPTANANVLSSSLGGRGGNAGTPAGVPKNDGGPGGNGGSVAGGDVYNASIGAVFVNDTLVFGQASIFGQGGVGGSGAGDGGLPGKPGTAGTAVAGGYFAASGSTNSIGNTIIGNNTAAADSDAAGDFQSAGGNVLTTIAGATGFNTGSGGTDQVVTPAQLDIGPLLDNGGPTLTDALLANSAAIRAGNVKLIPNGVTTDQRGSGFSRTFTDPTTNTVSVSAGAFQFLPPVIAVNGLSPDSVIQDSPDLKLTVTGSNFVTGATVTFGSTTLATISSSSTQIVALIPAKLLTTPGTVPVYVNVPDGSGVPNSFVTSAPANFTIQEIPFTLNNPGGQQNYVGESVSLQITPASGFTADGFQATGLPPGLAIDPTTGIISGTVDNSASTTTPYSVTVTATDSSGDQAGNTASVSFSWTIGPPLVLNNPGPQTSGEGDTVALLITAPPGYHPSGFLVQGLPPGLSINAATGLISGIIDPRGEGNYTVTVTPANNGGKGGVTFTWTVNDATPPALTNPGTQTSLAGSNVSLTIQAQDADPLTWTATGLPPGLSINAVGTILGTIAPNAQGIYAVTIAAMDGSIPSQPLQFVWNVSGSVLPPPPPPSPPGVIPPGTTGAATLTSIASVTNQYAGFVQLETVTVDVLNPNGYPVNEGVVAIQVDGQTAYAPVHNGVATATFATGLFDLALFADLLFGHPLTASYSDSAATFGPSSASTTVPAIWFDFFLTLLALDGGAI
jgi:hypothetical protein